MQMPRNGFDNLGAIARLSHDDTDAHRERWPTLDWGMGMEMDELRRCQDEAIDPDYHAALEAERTRCLMSQSSVTHCLRLSGCC